MSDEQDKLKLSLEPPRLFGRKKKSAPSAADPEPTDEAGTEPPAPAARPKPAAKKAPVKKAAEAPAKKAAAKAPAKKAPAKKAPAKKAPAKKTAAATAAEEVGTAEPAADPVVPASATGTAGTRWAPEPVAADAAAGTATEDAAADPVVDDVPTGAVVDDDTSTLVGTPDPDAEPVHDRDPAPQPLASTAPGPAEVRAAAPVQRSSRLPTRKTSAARPAPEVVPVPVDLDRAELEDAEIAARLADEDPLLPLYPAAAVTGAVIGGALVLLTWLSLRGCEAVRGTASCGGGPGFLLLVATFVVCVLLGSALLRAFSVPDPGSTSFLAVGLVAVVALLFLIDVLDAWPMLIVIPALAVLAYLTSVWVTKTFVEPGSESG